MAFSTLFSVSRNETQCPVFDFSHKFLQMPNYLLLSKLLESHVSKGLYQYLKKEKLALFCSHRKEKEEDLQSLKYQRLPPF